MAQGRQERTLLVTHRGRTVPVSLGVGTHVIGRSRSCPIFIDDSQISRRHAAFHVGDHIEVEDLGSHNGTRVVAQPASQSDETLSLGSTEELLLPNVRMIVQDNALVQVGTAVITIQSPRVQPVRKLGDDDYVVIDPAMQRALDLADRVAPTNLTVIVLGESGVGKDMLARYVHQRSPRAKQRLISLNCGALPEALLESELFGHEKGAFTGAVVMKQGLLEAADKGTLFLDEVGELPPALQVKLLRVLEDRQVQRLGAIEPHKVDVRFIAATNRDLEQQVAAGKFREDLYYRLYGIAIHVPPLRERPGDIMPLAERFIADLEPQLGRRPPMLSDAAKDKLRQYDWPGNVRQLKNVVHRASVLASGDMLDADAIELPARESRPSVPDVGDPEQLRQLAEVAERQQILDAIEACAGNQTRAAQMLGLTRRALIRRLEKFDVPRPRAKRDTDG